MPIPDPTARAQFLAFHLGPTRATGTPDTYTVHLYDDDPENGGVEIADETETEAGLVPNGYAPGTVDADDFTFDGEIATAWASMPASLEAYPDDVTWAVLKSGGLDRFSVLLREVLAVTGAGPAYLLGCSIFIDSAVEPPA